jgi:hypothetical protein
MKPPSYPAIFLTIFLIQLSWVPVVLAQNTIEVEGAIVEVGYNDVRIPGNTGTRFSLTDDLSSECSAAFRIRYSHTFLKKHWVGVLVAPLRVTSQGILNRDVEFQGTRFLQGTQVNATYRFDSYRLIYRYLFESRGAWQWGLGGALKVRDAAIRLQGAGRSSEKKNTGVVPLLSWMIRWSPKERMHLIMDGEALAAPQGRAEDILFAGLYDLNKQLSIKAGYRLLEGGADNDEVYTFSLFNQYIAGLVFSF